MIDANLIPFHSQKQHFFRSAIYFLPQNLETDRVEEEGRLLGDRHAVQRLLSGVADDGQHGDPPVLELGGAAVLGGGGVGGHEVKEVVADVAGLVVLGVLLHLAGIVLHEGGDAEAQGPVERVDLAEAAVEDGRGHARAGEEGGEVQGGGEAPVEKLSDGPADHGEHGEAAVLDLIGGAISAC